MLRLAWELNEVARAGGDCRRYLLGGMCAMLGARAGACAVVQRIGRGWRLRAPVACGSVGPEWPTAFERAIEGGPEGFVSALVQRAAASRGVVVCDDTQVPQEWRGCRLYKTACTAAGLEHVQACARATEEGRTAVWLAWFRPASAGPFEQHDLCAAEDFVAEIGGAVWQDLLRAQAEGSGPARRADVLRLLLTGASEKEVAAALGISRHTVHHHAKAIYKQHGVSSRAALMARLLCAGGGQG